MEEIVETKTEQEPVSTPSAAETKVDPSTLKADELKSLIEKQPEEPKTEISQEPKSEEKPKEEEWFDKEKGFKTKEDAIKSYTNLQETLRQRSEREKQLQAELESYKQKAVQTPLTEEEKTQQAQVEEWKKQNDQAITILTNEIKSRLEKESIQSEFKNAALKARNEWKENFDKDETRKQLWPKMEEIYARNDVFNDFAMNPLSYIESRALQENLPTILEKVRSEAVEQYKESLKQAAEAEKKSKTATPGGLKSLSGEIDVNKMSASEIASLLPRNDEG